MKNILLLLTILFASSCAGDVSETTKVGDKNSTKNFVKPAVSEVNPEDAYILGAGDALRITVFNEEELSCESEVDGSGYISMPLVGEIKAVGKTVRQIETDMETILEKGYLLSPRVNIEVLNFRPFFILGEVNNPGSYPYVSKLTVLNAVALAGGYTYRAKTSSIFLKRGDVERTVEEYDFVLPGDIIKIKERLF